MHGEIVGPMHSLRQMAADESSGAGMMRPPVARRGVVMLTIGCRTVLAWVEAPPENPLFVGQVGVHLQSGLGDALLSIGEMEDLRSALSGLIEEAELREDEIRSKLAEADLP